MSEVKRPRSKDHAIRRKAAEKTIQAVIEWLDSEFNEEQRETTLEQLAEALGSSTDGYEVCRYLDLEHGWKPDAHLVEILDEQFLWEAEREAVAEWVKENKITPNHQIGDQVSFNWYGSTWTAGRISAIYEGMGVYSVNLEHLKSFVLVPWEDAQLLPPGDPEDSGSDEILLDTGVRQDS